MFIDNAFPPHLAPFETWVTRVGHRSTLRPSSPIFAVHFTFRVSVSFFGSQLENDNFFLHRTRPVQLRVLAKGESCRIGPLKMRINEQPCLQPSLVVAVVGWLTTSRDNLPSTLWVKWKKTNISSLKTRISTNVNQQPQSCARSRSRMMSTAYSSMANEPMNANRLTVNGKFHTWRIIERSRIVRLERMTQISYRRISLSQALSSCWEGTFISRLVVGTGVVLS